MKHRWAAFVVMLALGAIMTKDAAAQGAIPGAPAKSEQRSSPGFQLGQNFPNPFNPTTTIPFALGDAPACTDAGKSYVVTLRIFNVLRQVVAVPILQGGDAAGQPVLNLRLRCGSYSAYWNGNLLNTGREVSSGVYLYSLEVDGKAVVKKMVVLK
jgi:hypothetical protein